MFSLPPPRLQTRSSEVYFLVWVFVRLILTANATRKPVRKKHNRSIQSHVKRDYFSTQMRFAQLDTADTLIGTTFLAASFKATCGQIINCQSKLSDSNFLIWSGLRQTLTVSLILCATTELHAFLQNFSVQWLSFPISALLCEESRQAIHGGQGAEVVSTKLLLA